MRQAVQDNPNLSQQEKTQIISQQPKYTPTQRQTAYTETTTAQSKTPSSVQKGKAVAENVKKTERRQRYRETTQYFAQNPDLLETAEERFIKEQTQKHKESLMEKQATVKKKKQFITITTKPKATSDPYAETVDEYKAWTAGHRPQDHKAKVIVTPREDITLGHVIKWKDHLSLLSVKRLIQTKGVKQVPKGYALTSLGLGMRGDLYRNLQTPLVQIRSEWERKATEYIEIRTRGKSQERLLDEGLIRPSTVKEAPYKYALSEQLSKEAFKASAPKPKPIVMTSFHEQDKLEGMRGRIQGLKNWEQSIAERGHRTREQFGLGFLNPKESDSWLKTVGKGLANIPYMASLGLSEFGERISLSGAKLASMYEGLARKETRMLTAKESFIRAPKETATYYDPRTPQGAVTWITAGTIPFIPAVMRTTTKYFPVKTRTVTTTTAGSSVIKVTGIGLEVGTRSKPLLLLNRSKNVPITQRVSLPSRSPKLLTRETIGEIALPETSLGTKTLKAISDLTPQEAMRSEGIIQASRVLKREPGLPVEDYLFNVKGLKNPKAATKIIEDFTGPREGVHFGSGISDQLPPGFRTLHPGDVDVVFPRMGGVKLSTDMPKLVRDLQMIGEEVRISPQNPLVIEFTRKGYQGNKFFEGKPGLDNVFVGSEEIAPAGFAGFYFANLKSGQSPGTVPFGRTRAIRAGEQLLRKGSAVHISRGFSDAAHPAFAEGGFFLGKGRRSLKDTAGFYQSGVGLVTLRKQSQVAPFQRLRVLRSKNTGIAERAMDTYIRSFTKEQQQAIGVQLKETTGHFHFRLSPSYEVSAKIAESLGKTMKGQSTVFSSRVLDVLSPKTSPQIKGSPRSAIPKSSIPSLGKSLSAFSKKPSAKSQSPSSIFKSKSPKSAQSPSMKSPKYKIPSLKSPSPSKYSSMFSPSIYGYGFSKSPSPIPGMSKSPSPYPSPRGKGSPYPMRTEEFIPKGGSPFKPLLKLGGIKPMKSPKAKKGRKRKFRYRATVFSAVTGFRAKEGLEGTLSGLGLRPLQRLKL